MAGGSYFAGIELGGTKSVALLAQGRQIVDLVRLPTLSPEETLGALRQQLGRWERDMGFQALGIASFGPMQLDAAQPRFGTMLDTPKPGWSGADVAGVLTAGLSCPWAIDTDVNGAALAEYRWGAGRGCDSLCYITIGTGVGGGLVIGGHPVHGAMHPEIGHLRLRRAAGDDFEGSCPFHGDCIEGLISGPALASRFGADPALIPDDDARWSYIASDLAELVSAILFTTSAQRVLVGGGIGMARAGLTRAARDLVVTRAGAYLPFLDREKADILIGLPELGDMAGPLGAIALAITAAKNAEAGAC
ncbi:ROK family protein [Altererythrobacter sp. CC-YST694]|uniref:ROK family protein n=1 Tax=Altererythrobacter sp. CC-YST694 TaxID=2755038 RepID=UPI001D025112|nr:ROK family protein [Altererythrobacter sp. CC-YST694]MCB5425992.1 ROK family protein [Altererythrobacter sp. CC-YST694]